MMLLGNQTLSWVSLEAPLCNHLHGNFDSGKGVCVLTLKSEAINRLSLSMIPLA